MKKFLLIALALCSMVPAPLNGQDLKDGTRTGRFLEKFLNYLTLDLQALSGLGPDGWLEMPSYSAASLAGTTTSSLKDLRLLTHRAPMNGEEVRNYTMLYDPEMYASYWVAYPLCTAHLGTGRDESWAFDPSVEQELQTKLTTGAYGVKLPSGNYYARGHQIPNADRNASGLDQMLAQTYYMTNVTPQLQNKLNGGIWSSLEAAVRKLTSSCDTVYVVTGAAFIKAGTEDTVGTIVNTKDGKTLPVPNYYWKALLKVHRDQGSSVSGASAIGFWISHEEHSDSYLNYTVSVDSLEAWTGLDLFANLPLPLQQEAESNTAWEVFSKY